MARATALFRLYQSAAALTVPFFARATVNRLRRAGVPVMRAHERLGHATADRRLGPLIWFQGHSARDTSALLPLMHQVAQTAPHVRMLLTSCTAGSAEAVANRLPFGAVHQFGPLDSTGPLERFLSHWRPDLCVLVHSDLWPNLLDRCARRDIPVALLDTQLTESSARGWRKFPDTTAFVLRGVVHAHCQDRQTQDHLRAMGLRCASAGTPLSSLIQTSHVPADRLDAANAALSGRRVWVAAATEPEESAAVLAAHATVLRDHPDLCLILAPAQGANAHDMLDKIRKERMTVAHQGAGDTLADGAQVFLADGTDAPDLWHAVSPIVFLGGTLTGGGPLSPLAPAAAHTAIVHGTAYGAHAETFTAFQLAQASVEVQDGTALALAVHTLLTHPSQAAQLAARARPMADHGTRKLHALANDVLALLQPE